MKSNCATCSFGKDLKPGGKKPSPGTVWCTKKTLQMGRNRILPCFKPKMGTLRTGRCMNCKWSNSTTPNGEALNIGHIWCKKKRIAIHKHRNMECFEK